MKNIWTFDEGLLRFGSNDMGLVMEKWCLEFSIGFQQHQVALTHPSVNNAPQLCHRQEVGVMEGRG
jgi:hypothetical protein